MRKRHILSLLAAAGLATTGAAARAADQPDLVPLLNNPMNATVGVQNIGFAAAGPSTLTLNCTKFGKVDGGCPDVPGMAAYVDPAFPNRVVIEVPALGPGDSFDHVLTFWNAIPWTPGTYIFEAEVDAGGVVAEGNEANNVTQSSHTQQPAVGIAPPPPLPLATAGQGGPPPEPAKAVRLRRPEKPQARELPFRVAAKASGPVRRR